MSKNKGDFTKEIEKEEILGEGLNLENEIKPEEPKKEEKTETKKGQKFKVYSIVSEKAVMAKGLEDDKWYSKPNNKYHIGDIIE